MVLEHGRKLPSSLIFGYHFARRYVPNPKKNYINTNITPSLANALKMFWKKYDSVRKMGKNWLRKQTNNPKNSRKM